MEDLNSLSIDELKKLRFKEKKPNLLTRSKNPLDKFTSIDELLRENQIALRDLIEEQHITNKILLALYIQEGANGEMTAKPIAGVDTEAILQGLRGGDDYQTQNVIHQGLSGNFEAFRVEGSGIIDVIKFVSSSSAVKNKAYSVRITCNRNILYANTFTELEARTPNERGMVFYEDTIKLEYIGMFKLISYTESLKIEVYNNPSAIFSLIQIKFHEKV